MFYDIFVLSVVALIENHVHETVSVPQIAAVTGFAPDYFRQIFKQVTGQTITRYIKNRKLSHAAFMLKNSKTKVTDIAMEYGFGSHDVFIRRFRDQYGMTPSDFRKSSITVKGAPILPGIYAPTVLNREENFMDRNFKSEDSMVLYGVPKVTYFKDKEIECTPFISSLRACLTYMGQEVTYARLLAGSGAAFRLLWNTHEWDGGNVDILVMRDDPFEPLKKAFTAAGRAFTLLPKAKDLSNKQEFISLIKQEIDAGRPLIGFGIIGPPEACVITGYRENGEVLLGWNFFQDMPEWKGSHETEDCGYFIRRNWYEHSETVALMAVGEPTEAVDEMLFLKDTLKLALEVMETPEVGPRAAGFAAYQEWAKAIGNDHEFSDNALLPILFTRLMCQTDAFTMVAEGRAYAGWFMKEEADKFPLYSAKLMEISGIFKREHETAFEMVQYHGGLQMGEYQAKELAKKENRIKIIELIRKTEALDRRAAGCIRQLVSEMEKGGE
ncbi:MAG: helix-turn-helix domain-containing protein [Ruminiclostridium sp.]|nr:helix-turn-helix domain-containing protein [Ruminiclostridium sp.]